MHGGSVHAKFYEEKNLKDIAQYCAKDVVVVAQLYFRIKNLMQFMCKLGNHPGEI